MSVHLQLHQRIMGVWSQGAGECCVLAGKRVQCWLNYRIVITQLLIGVLAPSCRPQPTTDRWAWPPTFMLSDPSNYTAIWPLTTTHTHTTQHTTHTHHTHHTHTHTHTPHTHTTHTHTHTHTTHTCTQTAHSIPKNNSTVRAVPASLLDVSTDNKNVQFLFVLT